MMAVAWQLKVRAPFGIFALACDNYSITHTTYLPPGERELPPQNMLAAEAMKQLRAYLRKPRKFIFELPLAAAPTLHQRRVREAVLKVAGGETRTYGDIAAQIKSSPRAVGGACRANFLPLIVPCHRIVAADGLGGFMGAQGHQHKIKKMLLQLEE